MSEEQKTTKILLTGDTKTCSHCQQDHERLSKLGDRYEYIDVNSERGQEKLREYGVKEGDHVDIPIIKVETCTTEPNEKGEAEKKCKTKDWRDEFWADVDKGELPKDVYI